MSCKSVPEWAGNECVSDPMPIDDATREFLGAWVHVAGAVMTDAE
jgi:hypothetical protein